MKPSEILREARNVLFERGWTTQQNEDREGKVCLVGAINVAEYGNARSTVVLVRNQGVLAALVAATDYPYPFGWNDHEAKSFDDVIDALDRAEKFALVAEESDE